MLTLIHLNRYIVGCIHYRFNDKTKRIGHSKKKLSHKTAVNGRQLCVSKGYRRNESYYQYYHLVDFINKKPNYKCITIAFKPNNELRIDIFPLFIYAKYQNNKIYNTWYESFGNIKHKVDEQNNKYTNYQTAWYIKRYTYKVLKKCINSQVNTISIYINLIGTDQYSKIELECNSGIINKINYIKEYLNRGIITSKKYIKE